MKIDKKIDKKIEIKIETKIETKIEMKKKKMMINDYILLEFNILFLNYKNTKFEIKTKNSCIN